MAPTSNRAFYVVAGPGSVRPGESQGKIEVKVVTKASHSVMNSFKVVLANEMPTQITERDVVIYRLKDVKSFLIRDVERRYQEIPQKEEEIVRIANLVTEWSDVFAGTLPDRYVHLIAWIPDITSETRKKLWEKDSTLFGEIAVKVNKFGHWTMDDVTENSAVFESLPSIDSLAIKLCKPRAYKNKTDITGIEARHFVELLKHHCAELKRDASTKNTADSFEDYFRLRSEATERIIRHPTNEFRRFANIKEISEDFAFDIVDPGRHSEALASPFITLFVQGPARDIRRESRQYFFGKDATWKFSIYLEFDAPQEGGGMMRELRKYRPKSDFRVDGLHGLPQLIGEVVSEPDHSDHCRMLIHAICIACAGALLGLEKAFIVFALYIDEKCIATRHLVCKDVDKKTVAISSKEFNLTDTTAARHLLLEIYNFLDYITDSGDDKGVLNRLIALNKEAAELKSLHTKDMRNKSETGKKGETGKESETSKKSETGKKSEAGKKSGADKKKDTSKRSSRSRIGTGLEEIKE